MSKIIISDDQNTVEVDGKKYVASQNNHCFFCDLYDLNLCHKILCGSSQRKDKRNVIFKLQK